MTQWDVSTAVYLKEISVAIKDITPAGVYFKPDGTKMYIIAYSGATVDEYDLGIQWDVSTAVYLQEISVAEKETQATDICFKPDGTKFYIVGHDGDAVNEYDLGTPWDVSTAVYLQEFSVAAKEIDPMGLFIKLDGTKIYTVGYEGDTVDEYDLGTQWDISTAVFLQEISIAAKETTPVGIKIKPDGTKMYIAGHDSDTIDEYDLGTPWNVSTAVYLREISVEAKEEKVQNVCFKKDGTKMYTVGSEVGVVVEYDL